MKISIISTGGTIACKKDDNIHLDSPFKVVDYADENLTREVDFSFSSPFTVLSENMDFALWQKLIAAVNESESDNIIILHGSDTLAYTSSLLANMFYDKNIVITASDKPIEDETANGISNFNAALMQVLKNQKGVFVSYNGIFSANEIVSADSSDNFLYLGKANEKIPSPRFAPKNILVSKPYINIDYNNYNIDNVDVVLHEMYHSATVPESAKAFAKKCAQKGVAFYFVTSKSSADYESASDIKDKIIYNSTLENAYAKILLSGK